MASGDSGLVPYFTLHPGSIWVSESPLPNLKNQHRRDPPRWLWGGFRLTHSAGRNQKAWWWGQLHKPVLSPAARVGWAGLIAEGLQWVEVFPVLQEGLTWVMRLLITYPEPFRPGAQTDSAKQGNAATKLFSSVLGGCTNYLLSKSNPWTGGDD